MADEIETQVEKPAPRRAKLGADAKLIIKPITQHQTQLFLLGETPLIYNAMSYKAKLGFLIPRGRMTEAQKRNSINKLRHNPEAEYRNSVYRHLDNEHATRLMFPAGAFKAALVTAAGEQGIQMTSIQRHIWLKDSTVDIYGIPQLLMSIVRNAGINRTPDERTRAILPEWACTITVCFTDRLTEQQVVDLTSTAGMLIGIGDFRQEKGAGNYGQFRVTDLRDTKFKAIVEMGNREAQDAALQIPCCYDAETLSLMEAFKAEVQARGIEMPSLASDLLDDDPDMSLNGAEPNAEV